MMHWLCVAFYCLLLQNVVDARRRRHHSEGSRYKNFDSPYGYRYADDSNYDDGGGGWEAALGRGIRTLKPKPTVKAVTQRSVGGNDKIVGGIDALPYQFPSIISIAHDKLTMCGGTLVKANWVLTAGHCVFDYDISKFVLTAGEYDKKVEEGFEQIRRVDKVVVYDKYNDAIIVNDIALMRVKKPFILNDKVEVARLPTRENFPIEARVTVAGWGAQKDGGKGVNTLQYVTLPVISDLRCQKLYKKDDIQDNQFCTMKEGGGQDACKGDSGGPVYSGFQNPTVVGVVSWGDGCAEPNHPGVFTEVSYFLPWIKKITADPKKPSGK